MIDTSPQFSESITQDKDHDDYKKSGASFGLRATCVILVLATFVLGYMVYQENSLVADTKTQLAQAISDASQTKSDLDKAASRATDLQHQLTVATAQTSDLQTQLKKAQSQSADLMAQLETAHSQSADLRTQINTAKDRLSEAQAQVSLANDSAVALRKQLDSEKAIVASMPTQVSAEPSDTAKAQPPSAQKLADMPVATTFEKSLWTGEYTLHMKNTGSEPLIVTITVTGTQNLPPVTAAIKSGSTYDLKKLQAGANVGVTSDGFTQVNLVAR